MTKRLAYGVSYLVAALFLYSGVHRKRGNNAIMHIFDFIS